MNSRCDALVPLPGCVNVVSERQTCPASTIGLSSCESVIQMDLLSTSVAPEDVCRHEPAAAPPPEAKAQAGSSYASGHFTVEKAGMKGVDKAHVARVVEEASKGSKYYQNAQAREAQLELKIARLKEVVARTSPAEIARLHETMQRYASKMEAERNLTRVCVCIDMDQFFAAVAMREDPKLEGVPFAVGGMGMISTASYEARKYGVRSAMPGFIGIKLCPSLIFVRSDFAAYAAAAEEYRVIFSEYDSAMSTGSLDEACLDMTAYCCKHGIIGAAPGEGGSGGGGGGAHASTATVTASPLRRVGCGQLISPVQQAAIAVTVQELRQRVKTTTRGLTCSAGIAVNHFLAKIASNDDKPDGQKLVPFDRESILEYMAALPVRKIPGVGKVTETLLQGLGVQTGADILAKMGVLRAAFNERMSQWLVRSALGISESDAFGWGVPGGDSGDEEGGGIGRKSISQERTFSDNSDWAFLSGKCRELAQHIGAQMREEGVTGKNITIKLKLATFEIRQKSVTIGKPTNSGDVIGEYAEALLRAEFPLTLRLLGVRVGTLSKVLDKPTLLDRFVTASGGGGRASKQQHGSGAPVVEEGGSDEDDCVFVESVQPAKRPRHDDDSGIHTHPESEESFTASHSASRDGSSARRRMHAAATGEESETSDGECEGELGYTHDNHDFEASVIELLDSQPGEVGSGEVCESDTVPGDTATAASSASGLKLRGVVVGSTGSSRSSSSAGLLHGKPCVGSVAGAKRLRDAPKAKAATSSGQVCPICNLAVLGSWSYFNKHVDVCLATLEARNSSAPHPPPAASAVASGHLSREPSATDNSKGAAGLAADGVILIDDD